MHWNLFRRSVRRSFNFFPLEKRQFPIRIVVIVLIVVVCCCAGTYLFFIPSAFLFFDFEKNSFRSVHVRYLIARFCHCIFNFPLERAFPSTREYKFCDSGTFCVCLVRFFPTAKIYSKVLLLLLSFLFGFSSVKWVCVLAGSHLCMYVFVYERRSSQTIGNEIETCSLTCKRCSLHSFTHIRSTLAMEWFFSAFFLSFCTKQQDTIFSVSFANWLSTPHSKLKWKFDYANTEFTLHIHSSKEHAHEIHLQIWNAAEFSSTSIASVPSGWMHKPPPNIFYIYDGFGYRQMMNFKLFKISDSSAFICHNQRLDRRKTDESKIMAKSQIWTARRERIERMPFRDAAKVVCQ